MLAVALTAMLLFFWGSSSAAPVGTGQEPGAAAAADTGVADTLGGASGADALIADSAAADTAANPARSVQQAGRTIRDLLRGFYALLPKLGIAAALLVVAWLLSRLARPVTERLLGRWPRSQGIAVVFGLVVWLTALVAAIAVLVGDARAVAGSIGILGLAFSWALQAPIESFTGWLLNSFRLYYRVGDRIAVGDVFGDVFRIDLLTTTVWEVGGPDKPVQGAQPTGALVTFPNSEVLRSNIVNYTRDFPAVWDEVTVGVANESDLALAARVARETAHEEIGEWMRQSASEYRSLLLRSSLPYDVAEAPEVYFSPADSWTNLTVRYLVPVRERRRQATDLLMALNRAFAGEAYRDRIVPAYPRQRVELVDDGPRETPS